ncbi:MAG: FeoB-associated Cys-rich membrane protein [Ruminococcus sp.]
MLEWLMNNISTIIVGMIVLAVIIAIVIRMIKNKKRGKTSCNCGCSGCPMGDSCHKEEK